MPMTAPLFRICLVVGLLGCALPGSLSAVDGEPPNICLALMKQHGDYLRADRIDLADKVSGRARSAGCYDRPADPQLCTLLAEQEQGYNLSGRMDLVNIVRGQERRLLCISARPRQEEGVEQRASAIRLRRRSRSSLMVCATRTALPSCAAMSVSSLGVFQNGKAVPDGDPKAKDRDIYTQRGCTQGGGPGCGGDDSAVISVSTRGLVELHNAFVTGIVLVRGVSNLEMDSSIMFGDVQSFDRSGSDIRLSVSGDGRLVCNVDAFAYGVASYSCGKQFASAPTHTDGSE